MSDSHNELKIEKLEKRLDQLEKKINAKQESPAKEIVRIPKAMLTIAEAAEFLGLEVNGVRMLTHKKLIPYYKPNGKTCYFDPKELAEWQKRNRQTPVYEKESPQENS